MSLEGKRALITGASRGIGAEIAKKLAADGADVAITYEKSTERAAGVVREIKALGRRAVAIQADSSDAEAVRRSISTAVEFLGGLDILVNNAGIFRSEPIEDMSHEDIEKMIRVNVLAPVVGSQAAISHLGKGGRIITIGSAFAETVFFPNVSVYVMTKSALIAFTKGLARELAPRGITANVVQPGATDTDMNPASGALAEALKPLIPTGQYGNPVDIARAVAFLASGDASYINGAVLTVDGGLIA